MPYVKLGYAFSGKSSIRILINQIFMLHNHIITNIIMKALSKGNEDPNKGPNPKAMQKGINSN